MDKVEQEKLLKLLREEEKTVWSELNELARKNPKAEGHFDVPYPDEDRDPDTNAREIMEFERIKAVADNLEQRLKDIKSAIEKLRAGSYGVCEKCSVKIGGGRLKAMPTANLCISCAKINTREI